MKKLLSLLSSIIMYNVLCAQTTVVQNIQVKTAQGTAPSTSMPVNGGLAYYDANGVIKKSDIKALLGKKVDSALKLNDSTIRFNSQYGNTYDVIIRGLYDLSTKGWADSLRSGKYKDTSVVRNLGSGGVSLASTTANSDTLQISTLRDSTDIGWVKNPDGSVSAYLPATSITPGTYGSATQVPVLVFDTKGRISGVSLIGITGGGGSTAKKTLNAQSGTSYTLVQSDTSTYITSSNGSPVTITIPTDASVPMSPPISIDIYQTGAGQVQFAGASGVSLNARAGKTRTAGQYSKVVLNKLSANTWILSGDLDTTNAGFLTASKTSLGAFTTVAGTASLADSFTVSGFNLTAGALVTAPSNFEVSLDNSAYGLTKSISLSGTSLASQPVKVYARITSTASVGSPSGSVTIASTGVSTQNVGVSGTVTGSVSAAKFNFSSTASSVAGWTNFFGDPTASPSFTDATTGWTLQAVGAGWAKLSGFYGGVGNGATSASTDGNFSQPSINSNLYSYNWGFGLTGYNLQFTNLPAGTYAIELLGSIPSSIYVTGGPASYHIQFGTGSDNITTFTPNDNLIGVGPGTTGVTTGSFTGTITTGQTIKIAVCTSGSGQLGIINGLIITKQ